MLTQLYNGHILTPQGWINGGSILMEDGRIVEIKNSSTLEAKAQEQVNVQDRHRCTHEAWHHRHVCHPVVVHPAHDRESLRNLLGAHERARQSHHGIAP